MKKSILALLFALTATVSLSARSRIIEIDDDYDDEDDVEVVYEYERPTRRTTYVRQRPVVRQVVYEPAYREVCYVDSDPGAAFASGLLGFGFGAALGAACSR